MIFRGTRIKSLKKFLFNYREIEERKDLYRSKNSLKKKKAKPGLSMRMTED